MNVQNSIEVSIHGRVFPGESGDHAPYPDSAAEALSSGPEEPLHGSVLLNTDNGRICVTGIADCRPYARDAAYHPLLPERSPRAGGRFVPSTDLHASRRGGEKLLDKIADYIFCNEAELFGETGWPETRISENFSELIYSCVSELSRAFRVRSPVFSSALLVFAFDMETGSYFTVHLGDGCILGAGAGRKTTIISAPNEGALPSCTWLSSSSLPAIRRHLRISLGNIRHYKRIILLSNGASPICNGKDITPRMQRMLSGERTGEILTYMENSAAGSPAAILIIDQD